ncbi:Cystathionine beta-lyase PatB [Vibrio stylophorae]|uniref:cysteine-S-conjugate beta-lyase n=1 Tax=Vibrio stylophorae TaxID=659351 RepID=A0ABN8E012_9VIBR|nr:aminotransferase class I/II-fold pyridoxal phosphate-dependent enzyme [Vibrio stylophorae]CAH0534404.1 Cystathionine beta-lyase PatB [Vibrio stylophorae]
MMKHNFEQFIDRKGTQCWKWDQEGSLVSYPMGCADTDFRAPQEIVDALKSKIDEGILAYGEGVPSALNEALAGYYQRRHNMSVAPQHFIYFSGIIVAMKIVLDAFTVAGDKVIVQTPAFHNFGHLLDVNGRIMLENELVFNAQTRQYQVDFEELEAQASDPRCKVMVLCNPHNPVGKAFSKEELLQIHRICSCHGVMVFSDEVHGDIYYDGKQHVPYLSIGENVEQHAMIVSASGKTFNIHGMYASYLMICDEELKTRFQQAASRMHFDYSILGALANTVAYSGECDYYIDGLVGYLQTNLDYIRAFLKDNDIAVQLIEPDATYLVWLDFSQWNIPGAGLKQLLAKHGLGINEGEKFGKGGAGFVRMNTACHMDTLIGAMNAIKKAYEQEVKNK